MSGPLAGLRVIELADTLAAYAGKLLGDLGADVVKVEPPGGDPLRAVPPFVGDEPHPERSLSFWQYHTSKRSIVLDLEQEGARGVFHDLAAGADLVLEDRPPGALAALGIDHADVRDALPRLIWIAVTPFGRDMPRSLEHANDLTLLAGGGPAWSTGYDDHSLPPVRGGGNQAHHVASHFAMMSALTAVLARDVTGRGQFIDVNAHAAANVTTEAGSYTWLVAQDTVQRQTGRHAGIRPSMPSQVQCADGRWVNTGFPARRRADFVAMCGWLRDLGFADAFPMMAMLEAGQEIERIDFTQIETNALMREAFTAGREAMTFIAERVPAYRFFTDGQARGFQVGIIYSPEEVLGDRHFQERGWAVEVEHPEIGRTVTYPGAPYRFTASPWAISRRAPLLGEHTDEILAETGRDAAAIAALRATGAAH